MIVNDLRLNYFKIINISIMWVSQLKSLIFLIIIFFIKIIINTSFILQIKKQKCMKKEFLFAKKNITWSMNF